MVNIHPTRTASLPPRQSIQNTNVARRPRVSHLPGHPRVHANTFPKTFPCGFQVIYDGEAIPEASVACGNSAFQVLLNIPIFINFVRSHVRKSCTITNCLTCALSSVASMYWLQQLDESGERVLAENLGNLWQRCLKTCWGRSEVRQSQIGLVDVHGDVYTESLMLNFLAEIQSQLEVFPSDYQTFQRLFTSNIARRRKCSFEHCGHISTPFWESSLYLPVDVQKHTPDRRYTTVLEGLNHGLQRWTTETNGKETSTAAIGKCEKCGQDAPAYNEIVNMPEVLILVRDITELSSRDLPEIPYSKTLNLELTEQHTMKRIGVSFLLTAGTAETRARRNDKLQMITFAHGLTNDLWFAIEDGAIEATREMSDLDALQHPTSMRPSHSCLFPELLVYYRTDNHGLKNYGQRGSIARLPITPMIPDSAYQARTMIGASISDIFTQKIGSGILKFKIDLWPAEPSPDQIVDFTIRLGYEIAGYHWDGVVQDKLKPLTPRRTSEAADTPFDLNPIMRFRRRLNGESPTDKESRPQFWPLDSKVNEMEIDTQNPEPFSPSTTERLRQFWNVHAQTRRFFGQLGEGNNGNQNNNHRGNRAGFRGNNRGGRGRGGRGGHGFGGNGGGNGGNDDDSGGGGGPWRGGGGGGVYLGVRNNGGNDGGGGGRGRGRITKTYQRTFIGPVPAGRRRGNFMNRGGAY